MKNVIFTVCYVICFLMFACASRPLIAPQKMNLSQSRRAITINSKFFEVDRLGNIFTVDLNNRLFLFDNNGIKKYEYADNRLGSIASIDVSNPLNILVYFKDFGIIKILDNTLAEIKTIDLNQDGRFLFAYPICLSNDNNFWIFDAQNQKFLKINAKLEVMVESNRMSDLGLAGLIFDKIMETENLLIGSNSKNGFIIFDNFGQMLKKLDATDVRDFQFSNSKIIFQSSKAVFMQMIDLPTAYKINIPENIDVANARQIKLEKDRWYILYEDGIDWIERRK